MKIDILTLFPEMFTGPFEHSIVKRGQEHELVTIEFHQIRDFAEDKHKQVDDYPYGGGTGMVFKPEPVFRALDSIERLPGCCTVLLSPQGRRLTQNLVQELASRNQLILLCGHYEGLDERIRQHAIDLELSIGDYILTGGELPCMVLVDAVVRLVPGVLGAADAAYEESFSRGLLEYPQYTRPREFRGWQVPDILLSGDHARIRTWRQEQALARTLERRPELLEEAELDDEERRLLVALRKAQEF